jgi:hypothetical protein
MIKGILKKDHIPIGENFMSCNIVKFVNFLSHRVTKKNAFCGTGRKFGGWIDYGCKSNTIKNSHTDGSKNTLSPESNG